MVRRATARRRAPSGEQVRPIPPHPVAPAPEPAQAPWWAPWLAALALWGLLSSVSSERTRPQFEATPIFDAAFYADMTQSLYLGTPQGFAYSGMHARRVLGAWIVANGLALTTSLEAPAPPAIAFHYAPERYPRGWRSDPRVAEWSQRLCDAWRSLDRLATLAIFLTVFAILRRVQPKTSPWALLAATFVVCASPPLGRVFTAITLYNDLTGISLGLLALYGALRGWPLLAGACFGAGMLARENLALTWPCLAWALLRARTARPGRDLALLAATSFAPYALFAVFPLFPNVAPLDDATIGTAERTAGASHDYLALLRFHLTRASREPQGWLRQSIIYWHVLGPLALLTVRFQQWTRAALAEDALLWLSLGACVATSFFVDRYIVYGFFPLLLLARSVRFDRVGLPLAVTLTLLYLAATRFFSVNTVATLQVEYMPADAVQLSAYCGAAALALVVLSVWTAPREVRLA